jgi:hypothetical protein
MRIECPNRGALPSGLLASCLLERMSAQTRGVLERTATVRFRTDGHNIELSQYLGRILPAHRVPGCRRLNKQVKTNGYCPI